MLKNSGLLVLAAGGIYASYLTQGVVQEALAMKRFGVEQERFPYLKALNGIQSVACFLWAAVLLLIVGQKKDAKLPPFWAYWKPGVTNSIGPACGFEALKSISYPAQVLAKSCKMVPVMIMGTLVGGKRYSTIEYLCVGLIAGGVSLFASQSSAKVERRLAAPNAPLGYFLCFLNLAMDGYTNATQDAIHEKYRDSTALYTMCWMNFWCGLYYIVYLFGVTTTGTDLFRFCLVHQEAAWDLLLFCLCGAVGQLFIFYTIRRFGSLVTTIVTTTRKFFNILLSVLWVGNPLLTQQWVAVGLVFSGLLTSTYVKTRRRAAKPHVKKE